MPTDSHFYLIISVAFEKGICRKFKNCLVVPRTLLIPQHQGVFQSMIPTWLFEQAWSCAALWRLAGKVSRSLRQRLHALQYCSDNLPTMPCPLKVLATMQVGLFFTCEASWNALHRASTSWPSTTYVFHLQSNKPSINCYSCCQSHEDKNNTPKQPCLSASEILQHWRILLGTGNLHKIIRISFNWYSTTLPKSGKLAKFTQSADSDTSWNPSEFKPLSYTS